ncbi:MAG: tetratricopeptide repeat protein [Rikenellaceae bacterium]|jgi:tetratricopeptide (TPR) repeat protein|nr:tetratricopeptide repeat protein [Rikenellaceae bacterium]
MKRFLATILLAAGLLTATQAPAQYDKRYFFRMGRDLLIDNQYGDAVRTLNILLKVDPRAYEGFFLRGIAKYSLGDLLGAEEDFSSAIIHNPVYTWAYIYRAYTRADLGNLKGALSDFDEVLGIRPDISNIYYNRGLTYYNNQQYENAIADFDRYLRSDGRSADAYVNRGRSYLMLKDTTRAFADYAEAIRSNRNSPAGYRWRGLLYMEQKRYEPALADLDRAIALDSTDLFSCFNRALIYAARNENSLALADYDRLASQLPDNPAVRFNRGVLYNNMRRPVQAIADFGKVIEVEPTNSGAYLNRALIRTDIGDYNNALEDYNALNRLAPENVLVYFNRALLLTRLGDYDGALKDYTQAIELFPEFSSAWVNRSLLRYRMGDMSGSKADMQAADRKIADYAKHRNDGKYSIYADTSQRFNHLISFADKYSDKDFSRVRSTSRQATLQPLFKFTLMRPDSVKSLDLNRFYARRVTDFTDEVANPLLRLSNRASDLPADTLMAMERRLAERENSSGGDWCAQFERGVILSLIRQYTPAINALTTAIDGNPSNPFLYFDRSTVRSEMIDYISSIDNNSYHRTTIDADPASLSKGGYSRSYSYDEAIEDLNKAARLLPEFAYIYYNRAGLLILSGRLQEAVADYDTALKYYPAMAEAYYNRGLAKIFLDDVRAGCLDLSKAGELGVREAYAILKQYSEQK